MKKLSGSLFGRYIGIDYSGAQVPESGLPGLRVYAAGSRGGPAEVRPSTGLRKHWTRRGIAEWLVRELGEGPPAVVGIDHGFSFPLKYFEQHGLGLDWPAFLDDFQRHWPTDAEATRVESVRNGTVGQGALRGGDSKWRRVADVRAGGAKSVFHFDVQGSVAKSTHAGLPWLRHIREQLPRSVHFWPFDGWEPQAGRSVIAEVYPSLWSRGLARGGRTPDQHDAWSAASWLQRTDLEGGLGRFLKPVLSEEDLKAAAIEGWILGVE